VNDPIAQHPPATAERERSIASRGGVALLAEAAPLGLGIASLDGTLLEANAALAECLGVASAEEIVGQSLRRFHAFPELAADVIGERIEEGSREGIELDIRRADGRDITVRLHARLFQLPAGTRAVVFSAEDVTDSQEAHELSTQGHKMEAVVRFAAGVAHDYNNLLTAIIGEARQLLADLPDGSESAEAATQILHAARRAGTITKRLLVFSKSEVARTKVLVLDEAITALQTEIEEELPSEVALVLRPEARAGAIRIDPSHVGQIVKALVSNARDAMPGGGRVVVETARYRAPEDTAGIDFHPEVPPGDYLSIAVGDNGIGMNQETRRRIFDPFFTTKPLGGGAGLGLTTVYGHVLRANGHLSVLSAPAHGTLVRILIPLCGDPVTSRSRDLATTVTPNEARHTVLVVDDEAPVLRVMGKILRRMGYDVLQAPDAFAAQEVVRGTERPIDLLVTDVMMPRMKGTELAEWLVDRRPGTPVLLVSGYTDSSVVQEWVDADPDVFLPKPFEPEDFMRRVHARLAGV
jgi:two-component system, cell cycle sensor histidine kinase and response regulator CckA